MAEANAGSGERRQVQAICKAAVRVLGASRFTAGRALAAMPDAVALSAEGPEREDLQLVWLIADGLACAAAKLRRYCQAWNPDFNDAPPIEDILTDALDEALGNEEPPT